VRVRARVCVCTHMCACAHAHVCVHVCVQACACVCVCVRACVFVLGGGLTDGQKENCVEISQELLANANGNENFLKNIITGDET